MSNPDEILVMSERGEILSSMSKTVEHQKDRAFSALRDEMHRQAWGATERRKKENPVPTEEELVLGAFVEELEPQVSDAVREMYRKGYSPNSSGFFIKDSPRTQCIDGFLGIDAETISHLEQIGARVEFLSPEYQALKFESETPDVEAIKQKWAEVVAILPFREELARPNNSYAADLFHQQFGRNKSVKIRVYESRQTRS